MVKALNQPEDRTTIARAPRVIEVMGPAGVGKTTFVETLRDRHPSLNTKVACSKLRYLPSLVRMLIMFAPRRLLRPKPSWFTWQETKLMVCLMAWRGQLQNSRFSERITVLDQGPLFMLVALREFGSWATKDVAWIRWREQALEQWAEMLDLIIWLDAPNQVLARRIRNRAKWHHVKTRPDAEIIDFLVRYRAEYQRVLSSLEARGATVMRFDTADKSVQQIADEVDIQCGYHPRDIARLDEVV